MKCLSGDNHDHNISGETMMVIIDSDYRPVYITSACKQQAFVLNHVTDKLDPSFLIL